MPSTHYETVTEIAPDAVVQWIEHGIFVSWDTIFERLETMNDAVNPMDYIAPTPEMLPRFEAIRAAMTTAYDAILANCPGSRERAIAMRHLQEARMWANAAISFEGKSYDV